MSISHSDSNKMKTLAQEGRQISKIMEDFPGYSYWDIYFEVHGRGQRSALGVKRMIANRLNRLVDATKEERKTIVDEVDDLVWHLYNNHITNQRKLQKIRKALEE
jgi:hypothetical protein